MASGTVNSQSDGQLNALINQAYRRSLRAMQWASTRGIARVPLQKDAVTVDLPSQVAVFAATLGSIEQVYWWDAASARHRYIRPGLTYGDRDWEPLNGTDDDEQARGHPQRWQQFADDPTTGTGLLRISPPADQPYELQIIYRVSPSLSDVADCPIDAEVVILAALHLVAMSDRDPRAAGLETEWMIAVDEMKRAQATGETFVQAVGWSVNGWCDRTGSDLAGNSPGVGGGGSAATASPGITVNGTPISQDGESPEELQAIVATESTTATVQITAAAPGQVTWPGPLVEEFIGGDTVTRIFSIAEGDNDIIIQHGATQITLTIVRVAITVGPALGLESAGTIDVGITRSDGGSALTFAYETTDDTAIDGTDYEHTEGTVELGGSDSTIVSVTIYDRPGDQGGRSFDMGVSWAG